MKGEVFVVYIMDEDADCANRVRESEAFHSMQTIGIIRERVFFLQMGKQDVLDQLHEVIARLRKISRVVKPDCILGQDCEGGHEAHDLASFCASEVARLERIQKHVVFPLYHGKPQERLGARFIEGRETVIELPLDEEGRRLKTDILNCHASQKAHFDGLRRSSPDY